MPNRSTALWSIFLSLILSTCFGTPVVQNFGAQREAPLAIVTDVLHPGYTYSVTKTPSSSVELLTNTGTYISTVENLRVLYFGPEKLSKKSDRIHVVGWDMAATPNIDTHGLALFPLSKAFSKEFVHNKIEVVWATVMPRDLELSTGTPMVSEKVAKFIGSSTQNDANKVLDKAEHSASSNRQLEPGKRKESVDNSASPPGSGLELPAEDDKATKQPKKRKRKSTLLKRSQLSPNDIYKTAAKFISVLQHDGEYQTLKSADRRVAYLGEETPEPNFLLLMRADPIKKDFLDGLCFFDGALVAFPGYRFILAKVKDEAEFTVPDDYNGPSRSILYQDLTKYAKSALPNSMKTKEAHGDLSDNEAGTSQQNKRTISAEVEARLGLANRIPGTRLEALRLDGGWEVVGHPFRRVLKLRGPHRFVMASKPQPSYKDKFVTFSGTRGEKRNKKPMLYIPVQILQGATFENIPETLDKIKEINDIVNPCDVSSNSGDDST